MKIKILLILFFFLPYSLFAIQTLVITSVNHSQISKVTQPILIEAYKRLGIDVSFEDYPAKRSLHLANEGKYFDGELHRIKGLERRYPNLVYIPVVIFRLEATVISKKVRFEVDGWESVRPFIIGIRRGVIFALNGTRDMNRTILNSNERLFSMLNGNRFDIIIVSRINASKFLPEEKNKKLMVLEPPVEVYEMYHYLHKKNTHLVPKLTKVLQDMEKEGLIQKYKDDFLKQLSSMP